MGVLFDWEPEETGETPWERPTFKDCVQADNHAVFLNGDEFAEKRTIRYDGETYRDVLIVEIGPDEFKRQSIVQMQSDYGQGLYKRKLLVYCAQCDLGGNKPEKGKTLALNTKEGGTYFRSYTVIRSETHVGMLRIELEEIDE